MEENSSCPFLKDDDFCDVIGAKVSKNDVKWMCKKNYTQCGEYQKNRE